MSDIKQDGIITTLHILGDKGDFKIEEELNHYSKKYKISIIIPVLYSDYIQPAMKDILHKLEEVKFIYQIILAVGRADHKQIAGILNDVKNHPIKITVLWMDNPELKELFNILKKNGLYLGPDGKGKSCWTSFGLILAQTDTDVIALHDSDIKTYSKEMLARLVYPLVKPDIPYRFSKGFYARFSNKLHGRVTRLFIFPLIKALQGVIGFHPLLQYLASFRYPLSGEFALKTGIAKIIRFPSDWGLEVSILYEIYRNLALKRVCQVELSHRYDHKHQVVSRKDPTRGLNKMAIDIASNIFKNLAAEGVVISIDSLKTIQKHYLKITEDMIANYFADSTINGLNFDRHSEESIAETFYQALDFSSDNYFLNASTLKMLPNWNRITCAYPNFLSDFLYIVNKNNKI
jgi:glucosyl-3-phosphoglycerate synthase